MKSNENTVLEVANQVSKIGKPYSISKNKMKYNDTEKYIQQKMEEYGRDKDYIMDHVIFDEYPWNYKYIMELIDNIGLDEEKIFNRISDENDISSWIEMTQEQIYISIDIMKGIFKGGQSITNYYDDGELLAKGRLIISKKTEKNALGEIHESYVGKKNGYYTMYYQGGQLKERGFYKDDVKVDMFEQYHENGQLKEKGNFKDGFKDGLWEYYQINGSLNIKETYRDGLKY